MSLTGTSVLVVLIIASVVVPVVLAVWAVRRRRRTDLVARWASGAVHFLGIVVCQVLLVLTVFVIVNRAEGFYTSWGDLLGTSHQNVDVHDGGGITPPPPPIHASKVAAHIPAAMRQGKVETITVHGRVSLVTMPVQVWLPPQYFDTAHPKTKFPVLVFMPGYPGAPTKVANAFQLTGNALTAISQGRVKPFIMVFPPITIRPGLDTECVNFPGGPRAESWITNDVRDAVLRHFRAEKSGKDWALAGWSTGGYCAVNLSLRNPKLFHAAVSVGGYFSPAFDRTNDPELAATERGLITANSPIDTYRTKPPASARLLLVTSKQDQDSWRGKWYADNEEMAALTRRSPGVTQINLPTGGHHIKTYVPTVPDIMIWLGQQGL